MTDYASFAARNHLKEKLDAGQVVACMILRISRGTEIARIAKAAGFDALYVDLEHSSASLDTTGQICMTAVDLGVTPLVRVADSSPEAICRVLDSGAMGIIVPGVSNAAGARVVVEGVKYPPLGIRSVSSGLPHFNYRSVPTAEGNAILNQRTMVNVMIESEEALGRIDEIAAVEGIDILHVGMNDLATALRLPLPLDPATVMDIFGKVLAAARRHGRHVGVGGLTNMPELLRALVKDGVRFISAGTELSFLLSAATERAKFVHGLQD